MSLTINTNMSSLDVQLSMSKSKLNSALSSLSTGLRIKTASDDAAGLAISEGMRADMRSMNVAVRNAMDGGSMAQVADSGLSGIMDNLSQMRELATQAANGTLSDQDRQALNQQFAAMRDSIDQTASTTSFNGQNLLDGSLSASLQVGINNTSQDQVTLKVDAANSSALGLGGGIATQEDARNMLETIDKSIDAINSSRSDIGAFQNRLDSVVSGLGTSYLNTAEAESRIRDADMAYESSRLVRESLMQQIQTSMLAQANVLPQTALNLLK